MKTKELSGAEIVLKCLLEQGVDAIFGYPGGTVLPIYDALYAYRDQIKHHLVAHEQGAAHAADGYARSTGRVGVCLATSGPGATNLVTGIATAYMDSQPVVAITGNVPTPLLGKDSFQEIDILGVTMPITKHNFIVRNVADLAETIRRAFGIARQGRPGPVLVDIPRDVQIARADYTPAAPAATDPAQYSRFDVSDLEAARAMIDAAKRPFIYAGGGVIAAGASAELAAFAKKVDAPVCVSAMGIGGFPASDPAFVGMIGMHGSATSNTLVSECDLLIAVGARFSDRVVSKVDRFAPNAQILHIDIDPAEINKNKKVHYSLVGDVNVLLAALNVELPTYTHPDWQARARELKQKFPLFVPRDNEEKADLLRPQYVLRRLSALMADQAIFCTEVGQHQMWACQNLQIEQSRRLITSGGLGTMGFGLGAAIGAAVANPGTTVFNIAGDGCFRMNNTELATAVEYDLPVIVCILNNHVLGMVRQWQTLFFDKRYSQTSLHTKTTDFIKLAEAYQATAFNVTKPCEVDDAIRQAVALKKPAVINFEIGEDEKVFPMVPPGAGIDEYVLDC